MTRKKVAPAPPSKRLSFELSPAQREQIAGVGLMALGIVTLLSLLGSQGDVTSFILQVLRVAVGWGVILAPVWFLLAGLYLFLDSLDKRPNIGLERIFGALLLYLVALSLVHLLTVSVEFPMDPAQIGTSGGGLLGQEISGLLRQIVGDPGAYVILIAIGLAGIVLLLNASLGQIAQAVTHLLARTRGEEIMPGVKINMGPARVPGTFAPLIPPQPKAEMASDKRARGDERSASGRLGSKEKRPAVVVGRAEPPQPPLPRLIPRIIGAESGEEKHDWTLPNADTMLEANAEPELSQVEIRDRVKTIEDTLAHFGVPARVIEVSPGPTVTQFGVEPGFLDRKGSDGQAKQVKVKVAAIAGLANDLALALAASPIRIEAPIPGRAMVGIEVPNAKASMVSLRSVVDSEAYKKQESQLKLALGQSVAGQPIVADLGSMPHLLIAGATGSGKSVCINAVIACLLMNNTPQSLKLIMVDPKMVELVTYKGIPHLKMPVITEVERVVDALVWATSEMDQRYKLFAQAGVRNLEGYNVYQAERNEPRRPYLVIIIDELADLMLSHAEECERLICRLAQMSRATGIHLILATQRPSVDVVTGLIKANFPARIAFAVTTQVDSRVILDAIGAEKLLGRGDMLYLSSDSSKPVRIQGCFVSDNELRQLVSHWRMQAVPEGSALELNHYGDSIAAAPEPPAFQQPLWEDVLAQQKAASAAAGRDELLDNAVGVVQQHGRASVSLLQRKLRIGYSRAARLIDLMEEEGIVGPPEEAGRERKVLIKGSTPSEERAWLDEDDT